MARNECVEVGSAKADTSAKANEGEGFGAHRVFDGANAQPKMMRCLRFSEEATGGVLVRSDRDRWFHARNPAQPPRALDKPRQK